MSRHNIRSPLTSGGAAYMRVTPHEWFKWSSPSSVIFLSRRVSTSLGSFSANASSIDFQHASRLSCVSETAAGCVSGWSVLSSGTSVILMDMPDLRCTFRDVSAGASASGACGSAAEVVCGAADAGGSAAGVFSGSGLGAADDGSGLSAATVAVAAGDATVCTGAGCCTLSVVPCSARGDLAIYGLVTTVASFISATSMKRRLLPASL